MSDKTLVERLREYEPIVVSESCAISTLLGIPCHDHCINCTKASLNALADAIEREYLPRPRFEDGEIVKIGDMVEWSFGEQKGKAKRVEDMRVSVDLSGQCGICASVLKRPEPEVLDADGVPIKVGDTVYAPEYLNIKCTVLAIEWLADGELVEVENSAGHKFRDTPDMFTHKQPDSLERIEEDATKLYIDYWKCGGIGCLNCGNEVRKSYNCKNCAVAMRLDLLKRQREVLERGR